MYNSNPISFKRVAAWIAVGIITLILVIGVILGVSAVFKSYNRHQKQADAHNAVKVTHILIQKAHQQAEINRAQIEATKAEAQKRYQAAIGIKRAQDEIQSTLTDRYIQFEAIEAQKAIATSGQNNTVIYVPSGTNGTPVITQDGSGGSAQIGAAQGGK